MISERYIERPRPMLVLQLAEADEAEIRAALDNSNLTITYGDGHWVFTASTGPSHEADDGDWVAYFGYFVASADNVRGDSNWQQVASADVDFVVS